jgi:hypothetical protein
VLCARFPGNFRALESARARQSKALIALMRDTARAQNSHQC